jgi:hypothetical protein
LKGQYRIDFGFKVDDRFVSAMPQIAVGVGIGVEFNFFSSFSPNVVDIDTFITDVDHLDSYADNVFMLIIY